MVIVDGWMLFSGDLFSMDIRFSIWYIAYVNFFSVYWIELLCWVFITYVLCAVSFLSVFCSLGVFLVEQAIRPGGWRLRHILLLVSQWASSTCSLIFILLSRCISLCGERSYRAEKTPNTCLSRGCERAKQHRDADIVRALRS